MPAKSRNVHPPTRAVKGAATTHWVLRTAVSTMLKGKRAACTPATTKRAVPQMSAWPGGVETTACHRGRIVPTMLAAVAKVGIKERTARLAARADAQAGIWEPASRAAPAPAKRTRPHKPHCAKAQLYRGCTARSGAT